MFNLQRTGKSLPTLQRTPAVSALEAKETRMIETFNTMNQRNSPLTEESDGNPRFIGAHFLELHFLIIPEFRFNSLQTMEFLINFRQQSPPKNGRAAKQPSAREGFAS